MRAGSLKNDFKKTIQHYLEDRTISPQFRIFLKSRFFNEPQNLAYEELPPLNLDILHWFDGTERNLVEDLLLEHALLGDISCVIGLRELQSEKSIEPLRRKLDENNSSIAYTSEATVTLLHLTDDFEVVDYIVYAIGRVGAKVSAARNLRHFPVTRAVHTLQQLLCHPDHRIVAEAICSLLHIYGELSEEALENRAPIIRVLIAHDDVYRELAIQTMMKVIQEIPLKAPST